MIYEEVEALTKSDDNYKFVNFSDFFFNLAFCSVYRQSNEIFKSVQNLKRFCVPTFMLNKMKDFIKHVQGM